MASSTVPREVDATAETLAAVRAKAKRNDGYEIDPEELGLHVVKCPAETEPDIEYVDPQLCTTSRKTNYLTCGQNG